jgi:hypothetical protein
VRITSNNSSAPVVLVPQPLEDAFGRVPLLLRGRPVGFEDPMDDRQERVEFGAGARDAAAERLGFGPSGHLLQGLPVQAVLAARLPVADLAGEYAAAGLGPGLHVGEHSVLRP